MNGPEMQSMQRGGVPRAVGAGAVYFLIMFALGWVFGSIREVTVVPMLGATAGVVLEFPFIFAASVVVALGVIKLCAVPARLGPRLMMGLAALLLLLGAEALMRSMLKGQTMRDYVESFATVRGMFFALAAVIYGAMPVILGGLGGLRTSDTHPTANTSP